MILCRLPEYAVVDSFCDLAPGVIDYVECDVVLMSPGVYYRGKILDINDCIEINAGIISECTFVREHKSPTAITHIKYINGKTMCGKETAGLITTMDHGYFVCMDCQYVYWNMENA